MFKIILLLFSLADPPAFPPMISVHALDFASRAACEEYKATAENKAAVAEITEQLTAQLGEGTFQLLNECKLAGQPA
jgi:hypothetical protein